MARDLAARSSYRVSISNDLDSSRPLRFCFDPKKASHLGSEGNAETSEPRYTLLVRGSTEAPELHWESTPTRRATRDKLEAIARERLALRSEWLERVQMLVKTVKCWAEELEWATRIVDKRMKDSEIGAYKAHALLLQKEAVRLFLEPVSRNVPGAEGLFELCLMPSYDDVASIWLEDGRWKLEYRFERFQTHGKSEPAAPVPLTEETVREVFDAMMAHAG